jgi:HEPN/RES N-terminal domain 1
MDAYDFNLWGRGTSKFGSGHPKHHKKGVARALDIRDDAPLSDIAPPVTRHTLSTGQGWRLRHRPPRRRARPRETLVADADDCHDTYICHRCVGDSFLKQEIRRDGRKQECHFCGKTRKAWPLDELAERVQSVIEEHFRITPSDPNEEGFVYDKDMDWQRRGDPVADVIADIAELDSEPAEAVRERLSEKTRYDAFEGGYEEPFDSDTYYEEGNPDTHGFHESWEFFRQEVRTRSRFFGRNAQRALDEIFGDLASLKTWEGRPAIKEILPTDEARFLYRARIAYSESELREILLDPVRRQGRLHHALPALDA